MNIKQVSMVIAALVAAGACKSDKDAKPAAGSGSAGSAATAPAVTPPATTPAAPPAAPPAAATAEADGLLAADAAKVALPFCKKAITKVSEADMPTFKHLVASARNPRPVAEDAVADKLIAYTANVAFREDSRGTKIIISPADEDPCKQDPTMGLTNNRKPLITLDLKEPTLRTYIHPYNDVMTAEKYQQVDAHHGWALEGKNADGLDFNSDYIRGVTMFKVTKYEKGKLIEGQLATCLDPAQYEGDNNDIRAFAIGPISAKMCPEE